jgi:hypothetical protein
MNSVRQSCRPKHQALILKCYPRFQKGVQEVKPNPSELSYLLYYASTRRSKLQKVGAFLEKRASRDVWRGRLGNVQVTLQILTALIEKLPRDLPLYARSVLTVIETVLRSNDISMVEETISTFETFCIHQDMAALAAEQEYTNQYLGIVELFASFASPASSLHSKMGLSPPISIRWRNTGLKAIKSIVSSKGLSADSGKQLNIIVPVILQNLYSGEEDVLVTQQMKTLNSEKNEREVSRRRRTSAVTVQTVDTVEGNVASASGSVADADQVAEAEARVLALRCLERIFTGGNKAQVRIAAGLVLRFIISRHRIQDAEKGLPVTGTTGDWATSLVEGIARCCPVQDRFLILVTAMENLLATPVVEDNLLQHISLAFMIDWLLKSSINMIGLSVIDVLLDFVQHILQVLKLPILPTIIPADSSESTKDMADASVQDPGLQSKATLSFLQENLLCLLQQCIGDLTTHTYYADQVFDMIKTILVRIKPVSALEASPDVGLGNPSDGITVVTNSSTFQEDQRFEMFFCTSAARITALKAIKNILVVANLRKTSFGAGVESRNRVGIQVWDGTQWLLRDADRGVRHAYTDALLSWLQLETSKNDLRVKDDIKKLSRSHSKRETGERGDRGTKRVVSGASQKEKSSSVTQCIFLEFLHLAIYENAMESPNAESDILLLHLLLVNLIENLGVNAVRFGLPMTLRLQDDLASAESFRSSVAQINIGSLTYGYLAALSEKFDFEASKVGSDIYAEILRRRQRRLWLERIRLTPISLDQIITGGDVAPSVQNPEVKESPVPFTATEELVRQIENSYNASSASPSQSPTSSPGRSFTGYPFAQVYGEKSAKLQQEDALPADIKEQLLSPWSKEACLTAIEKEGTTASSLCGSRPATLSKRTFGQLNEAGTITPNRTGSPGAAHRREHHASSIYGLGASGNLHQNRRSIGPEGSLSPPTGSSRDSTLRVNDLKRVLSVATSMRRSSPLRGRLGASTSSVISLSSDSMISGTFSTSDVGGEHMSSKPQSLKEGVGRTTRESSETPKASATNLPNASEDSAPLSRVDSNGIPPVPPLPPGLSIPGGYPVDSASSRRSSSPSPSPVSDRPSTAPDPRRRATGKAKPEAPLEPRQSRSLSGRKSRSTNNLAGASSRRTFSSSLSEEHGRGDSCRSSVVSGPVRTVSQRLDIENILDGILLNDNDKDDDNSSAIGSLPSSLRLTGFFVGRRPDPAINDHLGEYKSTRTSDKKGLSGIGRPPY